MVFANISAPELRARSVAEPVIHFVERNRAHLQRTSQQQQMFRGMVQKPNMPGQASEPGRMNSDLLGSFPNMLSSQKSGSMPPAGARPPPPQGHLPAGMNVPGTMNALRPLIPTQEQSQEATQFVQRLKKRVYREVSAHREAASST